MNVDKIQIQVRNPWGNETEWKGTWADGGKEWGFIPDEVQTFCIQHSLYLGFLLTCHQLT